LTETEQNPIELLREQALKLVDEIFDNVHGIMLDPQDSFFTTLADVSADQASITHAPGTGTIAAHVDHTAFYINVVLDGIEGADWSQSWTITAVTDAEWARLKDNLRAAQIHLSESIRNRTDWTGYAMMDLLGLVSHCSYHLGQVREIVATLRR
jgi:hypothetical protein